MMLTKEQVVSRYLRDLSKKEYLFFSEWDHDMLLMAARIIEDLTQETPNASNPKEVP